MNIWFFLVLFGEEIGENIRYIRSLIYRRENKMVFVEGIRLGVGWEVMWLFLMRFVSFLELGIFCCFYGNTDFGNLVIFIFVGLGVYFCSFKNFGNYVIFIWGNYFFVVFFLGLVTFFRNFYFF